MATTYEIIKQIESSENFSLLLKKNVLSLSITVKKVYYERFLSELKLTSKRCQAISNTAEEFKVSHKTIRRAVKFMES